MTAVDENYIVLPSGEYLRACPLCSSYNPCLHRPAEKPKGTVGMLYGIPVDEDRKDTEGKMFHCAGGNGYKGPIRPGDETVEERTFLVIHPQRTSRVSWYTSVQCDGDSHDKCKLSYCRCQCHSSRVEEWKQRVERIMLGDFEDRASVAAQRALEQMFRVISHVEKEAKDLGNREVLLGGHNHDDRCEFVCPVNAARNKLFSEARADERSKVIQEVREKIENIKEPGGTFAGNLWNMVIDAALSCLSQPTQEQ